MTHFFILTVCLWASGTQCQPVSAHPTMPACQAGRARWPANERKTAADLSRERIALFCDRQQQREAARPEPSAKLAAGAGASRPAALKAFDASDLPMAFREAVTIMLLPALLFGSALAAGG